MHNISDIRKNYTLNTLAEKDLLEDPLKQFSVWFQEAVESNVGEVNAMSLATANIDTLLPNVRIVLLKDLSEKGFTFFTNYESSKAEDIDNNNKVSALFFWKELERQVKIVGTAKKISEEENEIYFHSRPVESQIAAWASRQSKKIKNRQELEQRYLSYKNKFGSNIPKPKNWGGYLIIPFYIEFWQGRDSRLHDRIVYELKKNKWNLFRLSP